MITTLFGMGAFGFLGLSVLCPLLAITAYYFRNRKSHKYLSAGKNSTFPVSSIEIILPAHNEALHIHATLGSILRSLRHFQTTYGSAAVPHITIHVGADGCTDNTPQLARDYQQVKVTEFQENQSKWATIKALLMDSTSDWVILVDVGTLWPENFLSKFVRQTHLQPHAIAIAPAYRPLKAGRLPRILWQIEMSLKQIEAFCGGPISLHGATVGYKTDLLKNVLAYLGDTQWLNDDVVIPLILRSQNPEGVILYPVGEVQDAGMQPSKMDLGRRKRMLLGNLQWVQKLLPDCFRLNPIAGMVAGRRLFRVLWAYWFAFTILGLAMAFHFIILPGIAALGVLWVMSGSFRQVSGAAFISLSTPFLLMRSNIPLQESWK